jgi:hypothetical protein
VRLHSGITEAASIAIYSAVASIAIGVGGTLISSSYAASGERPGRSLRAAGGDAASAAQYAIDIANYNAEVQRQSAVTYQLALYRANRTSSFRN